MIGQWVWGKGKAATFAEGTVHPDLPGVGLNEIFGDGQSQSCAAQRLEEMAQAVADWTEGEGRPSGHIITEP